MPPPRVVVKVGGSLYDLPDLGPRLRTFLHEQCAGASVMLIPGGGPLVEAVRHLDRSHALGEETSHWLALRALTLNAHFLAALLPSARIVRDVEQEMNDELSLLDVHAFACIDETRPGRLPHCWAVTSDALAARVAVVVGAQQLILLKSTTISPDVNWTEAARRGWVDERFAEVLREASHLLKVSAVNLRTILGVGGHF